MGAGDIFLHFLSDETTLSTNMNVYSAIEYDIISKVNRITGIEVHTRVNRNILRFYFFHTWDVTV